MRKLTYSAAVSLDGFIAGPGEAVDWLLWSDDANAILAEAWKGVDAVLYGRRTFEFATRGGGGSGGGGRMRSYVFSTTMAAAPKDAELVGADAAGFVARLKAAPGGGIWLMGGGVLAASLIEAGLVDELAFSVHPVLLGGGAAAFGPMARRSALDLVEARPIAKGCLFVRYRAAG